MGRRPWRRRARRQPRCESEVSRGGGDGARLGVSRALQPPPSGAAPARTVSAGITFPLGRAVWRSLASDPVRRMQQNLRGERRAGWRGALRGQCVALYRRCLPRQPPAPARQVRRGPLPCLGRWQRLSLPLPSRSGLQSLMLRGGSPALPRVPPAPPAAPRLRFLPWRCAGGASGPGGHAGASGFGAQACGERSASGRRSGLGRRGRLCALEAGWREGRCPAPTEQATVWFSDPSTH